MKLLNDEILVSYVDRSDPLLVKGLTRPPDWFAKDSPIQPSSIDLHIGSIYLPGAKLSEKGLEITPLGAHTLLPGQTAVVVTLETLCLPNNVAAVGFPPSHVSVKGLLMTNPGHVDPGYSGLMRFTVINMGRENFDLLRGFTIVTLLFFEMSSPAKRDYGVRNAGATFGPPKQEEINKLSSDFLDFTDRATRIAKDQAQSLDIRRNVIIGLISLALLTATYFAPLLTGLGDLKERVARLEGSKGLEQRVTALENHLQSQSAGTGVAGGSSSGAPVPSPKPQSGEPKK